MEMKKFTAIMTSVLLSASCLAGCGSGQAPEAGKTASADTTQGSEKGTAVQTESSSAAAEEAGDPFGKYPEEITLTCVRTLESTVKFEEGNPDRESLEQNIWQRAYKEQLGINLEYLWTPTTEQYNAKWNVAMASGDIPDCGVVDAVTYKALVEADLVEDMTDIYEQYASDSYKQAVADEDYLSKNYMTFDGRLLGLPQPGTQADSVNMMFIRKDWLDKVNMEAPTTIEELEKVAKAFQEAKLGGDNTIGIAACNSAEAGIHGLKGIMDAYGAYYDIWVEDGSGKLEYGTISEEMKEALLELQKMYKDGLLPVDMATLDNTQAGEAVVSGKCGITFGTFWAPLNSISDNVKADENAQWIVCGLPTPDGSPFKTSASAEPSGYVFVKKGCEHPEAVVKLMNLGFKIFESGDRDYNVDDQGFEVFKYKFAYYTDIPWKNLNSQILIKEALETGDTSKFTPNDQNNYEQVVAGMNGSRDSIGMLLTFGPEGTFALIDQLKKEDRIVANAYQALVTDTMSEKGTDLKANLDAAIYKVIMGDDISVFDKAVEAWKTNGGNQMIQEVNDWYSSR